MKICACIFSVDWERYLQSWDRIELWNEPQKITFHIAILVAIILLAVAIFASVLAVSASAAEIQPYNNVDQAYSFNFNGSWWQDDLHQYWKENSTSVYIYSKAFPGRYNIYTNGYVNGSWGDYTQRPAVVPGVGEYLIYNTIYESNGYERTYARLGGFRAGGGTASGLWSPDSVGSYPHINP